jgi:hypothetical protein
MSVQVDGVGGRSRKALLTLIRGSPHGRASWSLRSETAPARRRREVRAGLMPCAAYPSSEPFSFLPLFILSPEAIEPIELAGLYRYRSD